MLGHGELCPRQLIPPAPYDLSSLKRAARKLEKAIAAGEISAPVQRIAVLSSFLCQPLAEILPPLLLRSGIVSQVAVGPYGSIAAEILGNQHFEAGCDLALLLPSHRDLLHVPPIGTSHEEAARLAQVEARHWQDLWSRLTVPIVQLSFDPPPIRTLGELDGFVPGGRLHHVRATNRELGTQAPNHVMLVDAEALAMRVGPAWHDAALYAACKQPFGAAAMIELAETLVAAIAGVLGKSRKVLVLDLDNTLWGGVVGDLGVDGITLGNETAEGEAFAALQGHAKALADRGVILAVCSKNETENAREPFRSHPSMILRESDIACFVANFEDKATNLRRIAATLNVGLDSLVFLDDNPVERALVAKELPQVQVVDLPDDPAGYCAALEAIKAFPLARITAEDLGRNRSYQARTMVEEMQSSEIDLDQFLKSLAAKGAVEPVGPRSVDRIVQLIAKTNQFKLNPRLFSSQEITERRDDVIALRFADNLQDYGIVTAVVTEMNGNALSILNWVMSCRVFSRRLEIATMEIVRQLAAARGATEISLNYVASAKNKLVPAILDSLGFVFDAEQGHHLAAVSSPVALPSHHIDIATIPSATLGSPIEN